MEAAAEEDEVEDGVRDNAVVDEAAPAREPRRLNSVGIPLEFRRNVVETMSRRGPPMGLARFVRVQRDLRRPFKSPGRSFIKGTQRPRERVACAVQVERKRVSREKKKRSRGARVASQEVFRKNKKRRFRVKRTGIQEASASPTRPPSRPPTGRRLKRLIMKPQSPSAMRSCESSAWPAAAVAAAATEPATGPASAMPASSSADDGCLFMAITAPRKGMKTMGEKGTPQARIAAACPHSWKKIKPTC